MPHTGGLRAAGFSCPGVTDVVLFSMAKAAQDIRVCPTCGSRNKLKWDFCARCGESLQGVPVGEPQAVAGPSGPAAEPDHLPEAPAPVWPIFVVLVALGAGVWFYRSGFRVAAGPRPDPG